LRLSNRDKSPDHSWLSRMRTRLPHEAHEKVFGFVLKLVAERWLAKGERIGVDGSTMEANAALRTIVRRDNGETYREMLTRMVQESGVETPTVEELARFDRKRKGKTLSNADWESPIDPDAKITRMKDGTTHLASHGQIRVKRKLWGHGRHLRRRLDRGASQRRLMPRPCVLSAKTASARRESRMRSSGEAGARVSARPLPSHRARRK
jgi:hypothetical protein